MFSFTHMFYMLCPVNFIYGFSFRSLVILLFYILVTDTIIGYKLRYDIRYI